MSSNKICCTLNNGGVKRKVIEEKTYTEVSLGNYILGFAKVHKRLYNYWGKYWDASIWIFVFIYYQNYGRCVWNIFYLTITIMVYLDLKENVF